MNSELAIPKRDPEGLTAHLSNGTDAAALSHDTLPDEPLFSILPSRGWVDLNPRELWAYRELLYFLTWRDIKVRYKQTVLGVAWAVLQPVVIDADVHPVFRQAGAHALGRDPLPDLRLRGIAALDLRFQCGDRRGDSLVGSAALVTKVYFPRLMIPCAAVCAALVDFAIASVILFAMMIWYGVVLTGRC